MTETKTKTKTESKSVKELLKEQLANNTIMPIKTVVMVRLCIFLLGFISFLFLGVGSMNFVYLPLAVIMFFTLIMTLKNYLAIKEEKEPLNTP